MSEADRASYREEDSPRFLRERLVAQRWSVVLLEGGEVGYCLSKIRWGIPWGNRSQ